MKYFLIASLLMLSSMHQAHARRLAEALIEKRVLLKNQLEGLQTQEKQLTEEISQLKLRQLSSLIPSTHSTDIENVNAIANQPHPFDRRARSRSKSESFNKSLDPDISKSIFESVLHLSQTIADINNTMAELRKYRLPVPLFN